MKSGDDEMWAEAGLKRTVYQESPPQTITQGHPSYSLTVYAKAQHLKKTDDELAHARNMCSPMTLDSQTTSLLLSQEELQQREHLKALTPKALDHSRQVQSRAYIQNIHLDSAGGMMLTDDLQHVRDQSIFHQENALVKEIVRSEKEERANAALKYTFGQDIQFMDGEKELWAQRFGVTSLRKEDPSSKLIPLTQPQFPTQILFRDDDTIEPGQSNVLETGEKQAGTSKNYIDMTKEKFVPQGTFGFQARQTMSNEASFQPASLYSFSQSEFTPIKNTQTLREQVFSLAEADKLACTICGFICKSSKSLKKHMQNHKQDRPFLCEICNGSFLTSFDLKRHAIVHSQLAQSQNQNQSEEPKGYDCSLCDFETKRKESLIEHMKNKHSEKAYTCSFCDFASAFPDALKQHLLTHVDKLFACPLCRFKGTSAHQLRCHMISHARDKPFACSFCDEEYETSEDLQAHLITHSREKPFKCNQCEFICRNSSELKQHKVSAHSNGRTFNCFICEFTCTTVPALKEHMQVHQTDNSNFSCFLCSFTCRSPFFLTKHINRCHPQGKQFICSFCDYSSPESDSLREHIQECHSGDKKYLCTICGAYSKTSDHLKKHMMTHWEDKPYACELCSYTCSRSESLKRHMSCHSEERPFPCSLCQYASKTQHGLKSHMLLHTPEKHLACPLCDYMCKRPDVLRRHMKVHIKKIKRVKSEKLGFSYATEASSYDMEEVNDPRMNVS